MALFLLLALPQEELLEALRSGGIEERARAAKALEALGEAALPRLRELSRDPDREVSARARELVDVIERATAKKSFERVEAGLLAAKTLEVAGHASWTRDDRRIEGGLTLRLAGGGRARYAMACRIRAENGVDERRDAWLVSDGRRAAFDLAFLAGRFGGEAPAPAGEPRSRVLFARGGLAAAVEGWKQSGNADLETIAKIDRFRWKTPGKTLSYALVLAGHGELDVDLELSEDGQRVRQRTMKGGRVAILEVYDRWIADGSMADDVFELPGQK